MGTVTLALGSTPSSSEVYLVPSQMDVLQNGFHAVAGLQSAVLPLLATVVALAVALVVGLIVR